MHFRLSGVASAGAVRSAGLLLSHGSQLRQDSGWPSCTMLQLRYLGQVALPPVPGSGLHAPPVSPPAPHPPGKDPAPPSSRGGSVSLKHLEASLLRCNAITRFLQPELRAGPPAPPAAKAGSQILPEPDACSTAALPSFGRVPSSRPRSSFAGEEVLPGLSSRSEQGADTLSPKAAPSLQRKTPVST